MVSGFSRVSRIARVSSNLDKAAPIAQHQCSIEYNFEKEKSEIGTRTVLVVLLVSYHEKERLVPDRLIFLHKERVFGGRSGAVDRGACGGFPFSLACSVVRVSKVSVGRLSKVE
jgi:hypothetical protein